MSNQNSVKWKNVNYNPINAYKLIVGFIFMVLLCCILIFLFTNVIYTNFYDDWENTSYKVIKVIDGDTIEVQGRFSKFKVRYIGIDTPETEKENQKGECYAKEAENFNRSLVENNFVYLQSDEESRDIYERELRYVYIKIDGKLQMVNLLLISEGYANSLKIEPNTKYANEFEKYENQAKSQNIGLWGVCN